MVAVVRMMKWTVEIERVYGEAWFRMEMKRENIERFLVLLSFERKGYV